MKTKDIIILVIGSIVIGVSIFFMIKLINPTTGKQNTKTEADNIQSIPNDFDEGTLNRLQSLSDYGKPALDNIGKPDLFAGY